MIEIILWLCSGLRGYVLLAGERVRQANLATPFPPPLLIRKVPTHTTLLLMHRVVIYTNQPSFMTVLFFYMPIILIVQAKISFKFRVKQQDEYLWSIGLLLLAALLH